MGSLRVSGFNPKSTTQPLLYELFCQGGPIKHISLGKRPQDDFAIVRFEHEESVPYCLALFEGLQLHGRVLRLNPMRYNKNTNSYINYLKVVRNKFRDEYSKIAPPSLPAKIIENSIEAPLDLTKDKRSIKKRPRKKNKPTNNFSLPNDTYVEDRPNNSTARKAQNSNSKPKKRTKVDRKPTPRGNNQQRQRQIPKQRQTKTKKKKINNNPKKPKKSQSKNASKKKPVKKATNKRR